MTIAWVIKFGCICIYGIYDWMLVPCTKNSAIFISHNQIIVAPIFANIARH